MPIENYFQYFILFSSTFLIKKIVIQNMQSGLDFKFCASNFEQVNKVDHCSMDNRLLTMNRFNWNLEDTFLLFSQTSIYYFF
jgi:hypothetical protein